ncbi:hypothetical protein ACLKA6_014608 [Drosophila palustris]
MGTHHQSHPPDFDSDSNPDTDTDPYPDPAMEMKTEQLSAVYVIFKCPPNVPYAGHILFLFLFLTSATEGVGHCVICWVTVACHLPNKLFAY